MAYTIKSYCVTCRGLRDHSIRRSMDSRYTLPDGGYCTQGHYLVRCCGCGRMSYKLEEANRNKKGRVTAQQSKYFPPPTSRDVPHWLPVLAAQPQGQFVAELLQEVYRALEGDSPRLATMGIRALIEHLMVAKVGDQGTFGANMRSFVTNGFITDAQKQVLEAVLEAGHAAMHRAYIPSRDDLITCMDITEHLLQALYVYPARAKQLRKRIPKRK